MGKIGFETPTGAQLTALHALYSKWHSHCIQDATDPRAARVAWASESIGREITSFKELTRDEARRLIDVLKTSLGQKLTRQPRPWRRIRERDRAHEAGTAGRKNAKPGVIQLVSPDDLARINEALERLGWTEECFQLWLQSASSPLHKPDMAIRTVAEANKVWWALKAMIVRNGKWDAEGGTRAKRRAVGADRGAKRVIS
jgi:hypothetical protein